jgi:hypothetical protein
LIISVEFIKVYVAEIYVMRSMNEWHIGTLLAANATIK